MYESLGVSYVYSVIILNLNIYVVIILSIKTTKVWKYNPISINLYL